MNEKVVKISIEASVAGRKLAVQGAKIVLGINSIPEIELMCAPTVQERISPLDTVVLRQSVSDWADLYKFLAEKAEGLNEKGSVEIELSGDEKFTLKLDGWLLAGAGLSSVGATSAPHLSVILQHPICKLTKVGAIYESLMYGIDDRLGAALGGDGAPSNFLEVVRKTYEIERTAQYWPLPANASAASEFRKNLGVGEFDPGEYLTFKGENGIFLAGTNPGLRSSMSRAIGSILHKSTGGSSTWDTLVSMQGALMLNITQDQQFNFTGRKLVIEPIQPWKKYSVTVDDTRCSMTDVPGMDPFKLVGVMCTKLGVYADPVQFGFVDMNGNPFDKKNAPVSECMYTPYGINLSMADGRVVKVEAPQALQAAFWKDGGSGEMITTYEGTTLSTVEDGYNAIIEKYCKASYETTVASMRGASTTMPVSFKDENGAYILPGNTMRFTSEGKPVFYGYIRSVVHNLSTSGDNSTTVSTAYVRPTEDFCIGGTTVIAAGSNNAAYESYY